MQRQDEALGDGKMQDVGKETNQSGVAHAQHQEQGAVWGECMLSGETDFPSQ